MARWAESLFAGALACLGAVALWRGFIRYNQVLELVGLVLLGLGLAVFWASFQRTRFALNKQGPGLVHVDEAEISYMTPEGGGSVSLAALTRLELRTTINEGRVWVLKQNDGPNLYVPVNATGAIGLFDAFAALPGIDPARLVTAVNANSDQRDVIWRRPDRFRALT